MKQGDTLQNVMLQLKDEAQRKRDFISPAPALMLYDDGRTLGISKNDQDNRNAEMLQTTDLFHRQVASALNIPAKYYDMMQRQKPELLATNVNSWLQSRDTNYMVRTLDYGSGQTARAFLSDRYRRIDNLEIAMAVLPIFMGDEQYEVMSAAVTSNRLYLLYESSYKRCFTNSLFIRTISFSFLNLLAPQPEKFV